MARPFAVGIHDVELYAPNAYVEQADLEAEDGCKGKYTIGLGQQQMGVCDAREDAVSMMMTAVARLLARTGIAPDRIGRLDVGTESLGDLSKSAKTLLMDLLPGAADVEGATHLNACYGGTAAFLAAADWVESPAGDGRWAGVVAGAGAKYARGPSRPTSGAAPSRFS